MVKIGMTLSKYLANAGHGVEEVVYQAEPGEYGVFTEPYNVGRGVKNPDAENLTREVKLKYPTIEAPVTPVH
jgi:hypothetical protein